jgi:hypothetical protein
MLVYGPSKLSNPSSTDGDFSPTASMVASGRETGYGPMNQSAIVMWIVSGAVALSIIVDDFVKGCYTWIA